MNSWGEQGENKTHQSGSSQLSELQCREKIVVGRMVQPEETAPQVTQTHFSQ